MSMCKSCYKAEGIRDICPYDAELGYGTKLCNCCEECREQCSQDI